MPNKKIIWSKSYILDVVVEQFDPEKYDFFQIVHKEDSNALDFEYELDNPGGAILFKAEIEAWDTGGSYEIDDITISNLEVIDNDSNIYHIVTTAEIEETLREQNFNL